jgi:flagellar hook-associated protein 1 FlgK
VVIRWQKDNFPATVDAGAAGGLLESINSVLPGYRSDLDAVAVRLRDDVNALHAGITGSIAVADQDQSATPSLDFQVALNGGGMVTASVAGADWSGAGGAAALQASLQAAFDAAIGAGTSTVTVTGGSGSPLAVSVVPTGTNELQVQAVTGNPGSAVLLGTTGVGLDGVGGRAFFTGTDAASLALSPLVDGVPDAVAAAAEGGGALDGSRALALAELGSSPTGADSLYRSFVVTLAVDGQTTAHRHEIQSQTAEQVDRAREGVSGVDIDEEMVNMVQFQHAYDASARYMTAVDDMLATLILRTGRVGL